MAQFRRTLAKHGARQLVVTAFGQMSSEQVSATACGQKGSSHKNKEDIETGGKMPPTQTIYAICNGNDPGVKWVIFLAPSKNVAGNPHLQLSILKPITWNKAEVH